MNYSKSPSRIIGGSTNTSSTHNPPNYRNHSRLSVYTRHDLDRSQYNENSQEPRKLKNETVVLPNKQELRMNSKSDIHNNYQSVLIKNPRISSGHDPDRSNYNEKYQEPRKLKNETGNSPNKSELRMIDKISSRDDPDRLKYNGTFQELEKLRTEMELFHNKYDILKMRYIKYKENYQKLLNENDEQKNNLRDLQKELYEMERKYGELEMNYDELKSENKKIRLTYSNKDKDDFLMTSYSSTDFKGTFQELEKLRTEMELLHDKYEILKMTCKRYKNDYQNLVKESDKQKSDKQLYIDALENEKNSIKKIEELEADLQKKQNAISSIRNKYKTLQSKNDELSGLTAFKAQSLSLQKQNEDFKHQVNNLTKLNENVTTQLELTTKENYQLKAEIKNMKLLKFGSKPTSSISANIQDLYVDENGKSQVKNEYSTQSFVNNEAESSIKDKNNINVQKFPAWWSKHMYPEISSNQMETTKNENSKSKAKIKDTKLLMIPYKSIPHNSENYNKDFHNSIDVNEKSEVENKNSTQTFVDIVSEPSKKDKTFPKNRTHSNIYPAWWSNHF